MSLITKLKIERPICFIDLETTGLDVEADRIVEITIIKVHPDGLEEIKTKRFNPNYPISPDATEKHGITNEMVENEPFFKQVAKGLHTFILDCDIAGYNIISYDGPLLYTEFQRVGINYDYSNVRIIDMCNIFKIKEERTLSAAYKFYCDKDLEGAHGSLADTTASLEILINQLNKYELPTDLDELNKFCNFDKERVDISGKFVFDDEGNILFNFSKHKGKKAKSEQSFLQWMISDKAKFSEDVNKIVRSLIVIS